MTNRIERSDLTRTTLGVLFLGGLIAAVFWTLRPFLPATIWATMVVVATWPALVRLEALLGGRRWLAVTLLTSALVLVFVLPLALGITAIAQNVGRISDWTRGASISSGGTMISFMCG